jgi:hypothetical protein
MARQAVRLRPHDCRLFLRASGRLAGGRVVPREQRMYLAPSSSGPGRRPLKAVAPVQIRSGLLEQQQVEGLIVECGGRALIICPSPCTWLVTSLFGDIAAALSEDVRQRLMMSTAVTSAALTGRRSPQFAQSRRHGRPGDSYHGHAL